MNAIGGKAHHMGEKKCKTRTAYVKPERRTGTGGWRA